MKKRIGILLLVFVILSMMSFSAMASETTNTANGFYNIESVSNVTIIPYAGENVVNAADKDVDNDGNADVWYQNSDRMKVSYSAASEDGYYGLIMVEGDDLPTVDNAIFYVDQITADSNTVEFDVYPILPEETTNLTIYISSNVESHELIKIGLGYAVGVEVDAEGPAVLYGDVNGDGKVTRNDLLRLAKNFSGFQVEINELAADVTGDGKVTRNDLLRLAKHFSGFEVVLGK